MATHIFMHMLNSLISKTSRIPVGQIFKDIILMMEEKLETRWLLRKYCQKDGNFISNFYKLNPWSLALDPEKSYEDSIEIIKKERPEKYILLLRANQKRQSEVKSEESLNSRTPH